MNLDQHYDDAVKLMYSIPEHLVTVTYIRPPSLTHDSSIVEATETRANCSAVPGKHLVIRPGPAAGETRFFTIRTTELTAILALGKPRKGDYLLKTDGKRYVLYAAEPDLGDRVWRLHTTESYDDDFGAIALAHTESEDYGDLTSETSTEDYGPLYL